LKLLPLNGCVIFLTIVSMIPRPADAQFNISPVSSSLVIQIPESGALVLSENPLNNVVLAVQQLLMKKEKSRTILGYTRGSRPVELYYFPGTGSKRALIIGGMHGSELSSIEMAYKLIEYLSAQDQVFYDVMIIPSLFPDNASKASRNYARRINDNSGRYTSEKAADPNRQMPPLGQSYNESCPFDIYGREIEKENQYLLSLIQEYKPERIANLHAIRDRNKAGIFADPRTDHNGIALGFSSDSLLAINMAQFICNNGGNADGNFKERPTTVYHKDPHAVQAGSLQKRNLEGSRLPGHKGHGTSLGSWATTAVCTEGRERDAIKLLTIELPTYRSSTFLAAGKEKFNYLLDLKLYSRAVLHVFLQEDCFE
jgi:hypothetical protein